MLPQQLQPIPVEHVRVDVDRGHGDFLLTFRRAARTLSGGFRRDNAGVLEIDFRLRGMAER
jgi:hypothetical protein